MTTTEQPKRADVKVEQRHRDAAADLAQWLTDAQAEWDNMPVWFDKDFPDAMRRAVWDHHDWLQAFAQFEADHLAKASSEVARLREALEAVRAWDEQTNPAGYGGFPDQVRRLVYDCLAHIEALRASSDRIKVNIDPWEAPAGGPAEQRLRDQRASSDREGGE